MRPLRIAIIGFGKIAADQHIPAIEANPRLEFAGSVSRSGSGPPPQYRSHEELLNSGESLDAVAITTPPAVRYKIARKCIQAGLHVLLEKPPAATLSEIEDLACLAEAEGLTLFATWHARHNTAVGRAAELLAGKRVSRMAVTWHEDVRKWHPGQEWIWKAGGFGVFDPGINALSIISQIFPGALFVRGADLHFPSNADTPIAAEIELDSAVADGPLRASFDWRSEDGEEWTVRVSGADGSDLLLSGGGAVLSVDGVRQELPDQGEYPALYQRFVDLIDERRSDVDVRPLRLVADTLLVGRRHTAEPVEC